MPEIPNWRSKVIPTSDPNIAEKEISDREMTKSQPFCAVCGEILKENDKRIICFKCSQYAHVSCSSRFENKVHCHLCIIKETAITKQMYKYLYGLMKDYKEKSIRKAGKFTKQELNEIRNRLLQSQLVAQTWFLLNRYEVTSKTQELLPMFEDIYGKEKDVKEFIGRLGVAK